MTYTSDLSSSRSEEVQAPVQGDVFTVAASAGMLLKPVVCLPLVLHRSDRCCSLQDKVRC